MAAVVGFGQHALVEREPRQLAVDEARRRQRIAHFGSPGRMSTICALVLTEPLLFRPPMVQRAHQYYRDDPAGVMSGARRVRF